MCSCAAMIETLVRLRVELEDWKSKNNKMQAELSQVRAQAEEMERKVEESKAENQQLTDTKEALITEGRALTVKLEKLMALNKYKFARIMLDVTNIVIIFSQGAQSIFVGR